MGSAEDAKENSRQMEALKLSLTHKRDGYHFTMCIQPNDMPEDLFRDLIGQRYMVVMVPLDDEDQPKVSEKKRGEQRLIASAHMLCREPEFWHYLNSLQDELFVTNEEEAGRILKALLRVKSRKELKDNTEAQEKMAGIMGEFTQWRGM